jgi:class 3 adenylate cyclase
MLTKQQRQAIELLASGADFATTAKAVGVSIRTLHNWRIRADFAGELQRMSDDAISHAGQRLAGFMADAVGVLAGIMNDTEQPASSRIRAAQAVLADGLRVRELTELAARITALESEISK